MFVSTSASHAHTFVVFLERLTPVFPPLFPDTKKTPRRFIVWRRPVLHKNIPMTCADISLKPMNDIEVFARSAWGIAAYLEQKIGERFRVVVGYDHAPQSEDGAETQNLTDVARIIEAAGGHALVIPRALPFPIGAFSLRMLLSDAAIILRPASSPRTDGIPRVEFALGGRATSREAEGVLVTAEERTAIDTFTASAPAMPDIPRAESGWEFIGQGMVDAYVDRVVLGKPATEKQSKIVYAPEYATTRLLTTTICERIGFRDVDVIGAPNAGVDDVAAQRVLDHASQNGADLVVITFDNGRRLRVGLPFGGDNPHWEYLDNDTVAYLLASEVARRHAMDSDAVLVAAESCSDALERVATRFHVRVARSADSMSHVARTPGIVFGCDEAFGYCLDPAMVRDADGLAAATTFALLTEKYVSRGRLLSDALPTF